MQPAFIPPQGALHRAAPSRGAPAPRGGAAAQAPLLAATPERQREQDGDKRARTLLGGQSLTSGGATYSPTSQTLLGDCVTPLTLVMTELSGPISLSW